MVVHGWNNLILIIVDVESALLSQVALNFDPPIPFDCLSHFSLFFLIFRGKNNIWTKVKSSSDNLKKKEY